MTTDFYNMCLPLFQNRVFTFRRILIGISPCLSNRIFHPICYTELRTYKKNKMIRNFVVLLIICVSLLYKIKVIRVNKRGITYIDEWQRLSNNFQAACENCEKNTTFVVKFNFGWTSAGHLKILLCVCMIC